MADSSKRETGHFGSVTSGSSFSGGILAPSRFAANPFASRATSHKSVNSPNISDSEDERKERPIIAPATFMPRIGVTDNISTTDPSASTDISPSSLYLRPSSLSSKTQNIGRGFMTEGDSSSPDRVGSTVGEKREVTNSTLKVKADISKSESHVSSSQTKNITSSSNSGDDKPKHEAETDSAKVCAGFLFGRNLDERVCGVPKVSDGPKEADKPPPSASELSSGSGFIFGQNLAERVTGTLNSSDVAKVNEDVTTTRLLHTCNAKDELATFDKTLVKAAVSECIVNSPEKNTQTLEESASAYQAKQTKQEFGVVHVITGEEDESNVLQVNCKLYMFEKETQNWLERGRGLLRLNDKQACDEEPFHSRIVMRTHGTFCVILNTKIWSGMMVERASPKSIRITGQCEEGIRVFLIMAAPKDVDHIFGAVDWRVQQLKMEEDQHLCAARKRCANNDNDDLDDEEDDYDDDDCTEPEAKKPKCDSTTSIPALLDPKERREVSVQDDSNDSSSIDQEASNESLNQENSVLL